MQNNFKFFFYFIIIFFALGQCKIFIIYLWTTNGNITT